MIDRNGIQIINIAVIYIGTIILNLFIKFVNTILYIEILNMRLLLPEFNIKNYVF